MNCEEDALPPPVQLSLHQPPHKGEAESRRASSFTRVLFLFRVAAGSTPVSRRRLRLDCRPTVHELRRAYAQGLFCHGGWKFLVGHERVFTRSFRTSGLLIISRFGHSPCAALIPPWQGKGLKSFKPASPRTGAEVEPQRKQIKRTTAGPDCHLSPFCVRTFGSCAEI